MNAPAAPAPLTAYCMPLLNAGERWRGLVFNAEGQPDHHVILLPGSLERATHAQAIKWAAEHGGELPTRAEGALLYANNADGTIERDWHWLVEQHAGDPGCAWYQFFSSGSQYWIRKSYKLRVVAVRRVPIQQFQPEAA